VLDLTGSWCRERTPQRSRLGHGTHLRAGRRGRTGHDATLLLVAGEPGFGFRRGQVWGCHIAWSGNHEHLVERLPEGAGLDAALIGGGELLAPGEVVLGPSESYAAPEAYFVHAADGLDGLSRRLHRQLRARPGHPASPRPVVLNTWEAVYFDHDLARLTALADVAARIGVERFVLDDGWFSHRRDDTAGLGDWYVDQEVWPQGLHPLVDHVRGRGLQFGLWVEPEMVNPDSDLARAHPDWILTPTAPLQRHQQGLDVANPAAFAYLLERLDRLVGEYRLDYLKWDHNRDLPDARHDAHPGIHDQTRATYRLLEQLRARHPGLEIESCSSGGARVDLGILQHTDRVWGSDTNDPFERQLIQLWTGLLLPPELVGTHIGPPVAHTTTRYAPLAFRAATALFGHAGIEWDITECSPEQLDALAAWIRLYKELSRLLHDGDVVRADGPDDGTLLYGAVAPDRAEAVFAYVRLETRADIYPARLRFPGLDPDRSYRVRPRYEAGSPSFGAKGLPSWLPAPQESGIGPGPAVTSHGGALLSGAVLGRAGVPAPVMHPGSALLLHLVPE
jgi:alpha-galactosidase